MSSVSSDLASLLSQYRVMTYHNLETGVDEGLVFVKKDEDSNTGELIRWAGGEGDSGHGDSLPVPVITSTASSSSSSTATTVTAACSRLSGQGNKERCNLETLPSTSHKKYQKPNYNSNLQSDDQMELVEETHNVANIKNTAFGSVDDELESPLSEGFISPNHSLNLPIGKMVSPAAVVNSNLLSISPKNSLKCAKYNPAPPVKNGTNHDVSNINTEASAESRPTSPHNRSEATISITSPSRNILTKPTKSASKSKIKIRKYLDDLKKAGESGWVREVIKGGKKSDDVNKIRIAYLPPKSLRNGTWKRMFNTQQLTQFLASFNNPTNLTKGNFSFTARVLGLGLPFEVFRHANIPKQRIAPEPKRTKKQSLVRVPDVEHAEAAISSDKCLKTKIKRLGSDDVQYIPIEHAKPLKPKQNLPERITKQDNITKPKTLPVSFKSSQSSNVGCSPSKEESRPVVGDSGDQQSPSQLNDVIRKPSPIVWMAGPETMDSPEIEIIGFKPAYSSFCKMKDDREIPATKNLCSGSNDHSVQQIKKSTIESRESLHRLPDCISVSRLSLS